MPRERYQWNDPLIPEQPKGITPLTEQDIKSLFPKVKARRLGIPDLAGIDWNNLDFLGWNNPLFNVGYVVYPFDGLLRGLVLTYSPPKNWVTKMCSWCHSYQSGNDIALYSATKVNNRNVSIGNYICKDLQCSLYARHLKLPSASQLFATTEANGRIWAMRQRIHGFFQDIYHGS